MLTAPADAEASGAAEDAGADAEASGAAEDAGADAEASGVAEDAGADASGAGDPLGCGAAVDRLPSAVAANQTPPMPWPLTSPAALSPLK